jgi:hypothetical protein
LQLAPADWTVKVVVNAIASVGAIIENEKPKASIPPKDLRASAILSRSFDRDDHAKRSSWIAHSESTSVTSSALANHLTKPLV